MGLDGTIKRADGRPLGTLAEVQDTLSTIFVGIVLGRLPSGAEKIRSAAERGIVFPDFLRQHFESAPASFGGKYEGAEFSAQFSLGSSDVVQEIDVVLYGTTTESDPLFSLLEVRYDWITAYPEA